MSTAQPRPEHQVEELVLVSVAGPTQIRLPLYGPGPVTIGRDSQQVLELADPRVSRNHAVLTREPPADADNVSWRLADQGSRHGTWLNRIRLTAGKPLPIHPGDLILIAPWTFRVTAPAAERGGTLLPTRSDLEMGPDITRIEAPADALARERLALLLECAGAIHGAPDETALAEAVLDAAVSGTGYANGAILRPIGAEECVEVIASRGAISDGTAEAQVSRSLIREALSGMPARLLSGAQPEQAALSIVQLAIGEALCVPIGLESQGPGRASGAVASLLYLDNRGGESRPEMTRDAGPFAVGLARLAAMALANLRRLDVERRHARVEAELEAAGEVQRMLMPRREGRVGPFSYAGECRPGRYVGGDFFDVVPLADGRLAVAIGDVAGKGVAASVLMTVSHGFLHAALLHHGDPARGVRELNRFIGPRCPGTRFLTLLVAVFDPAAGSVMCVDAGHGHGVLENDGMFETLTTTRECPIGVMDGIEYQAEVRALPSGGRVLLLSDGLLEEQRPLAPGQMPGPAMEFSLEGVRECLRDLEPGQDEIAALFEAVQRFSGRSELADDATAVVVRW